MRTKDYVRVLNIFLIFSLLLSILMPVTSAREQSLQYKQMESDSVVNSVYNSNIEIDSQTVVQSVYKEKSSYLIGLTESSVQSEFVSDMAMRTSSKNVIFESTYNRENLQQKNPQSFKVVKVVTAELSSQEAEELLNDPNVAYVEPDGSVELLVDSANTSVVETVYEIKNKSQTIPWGLHSTGAYISSKYKKYSERIVNIAVLDTGISSHEDLVVAGGVSFVDNVISIEDDHGHGTHVAGIIAAQDNDLGVVGVAPRSNIYSVKVLNSQGEGTYSQVIAGIDWAIANNMDIISMSLGGREESEALQQAIQTATEQGIVVVAAAGNSGYGENTLLYPAQYPEVLTVGALNPDHKRAGYSSVGPAVDIAAPGTNILSTTRNNGYGMLSGTSLAAAHVTGAVSFLWSQNSDWDALQVVGKLKDTATPIGSQAEYGHGLLNLARAAGYIDYAIAPSETYKTWESSIIQWPVRPSSEVEISAYDKVGSGQEINPGQGAYVSLKLAGEPDGSNPHNSIRISVFRASDPSSIIAQETRYNPSLDTPISYTWQTQETTPVGTYIIEYAYPSVPNTSDRFYIYVKQPIVNDTFEPNDSPESAYHVVSGSYTSYISHANDEDYYYVFVQNAGQLTVGLSVPNNVDYDLYIMDSNFQVVGQSRNPTGVYESVTVTVDAFSLYFIWVNGYSGAFSSLPYTLTVNIAESPLPPPPTGLQSTVTDNSITLSWNPVGAAESYDVRLNGTLVGNATSTSYTFTNLQSMTNYTIGVASVNNIGKSAFAEVQAKTSARVLRLNEPVDVIQETMFSFTPGTLGRYKLFTGPHGSFGQDNDTVLSLYSNAGSKLLTENDDANGTVFSEISAILQGGFPYYIKVSGYQGSSVRARITAVSETSSIPILQVNQPVDLNSPEGQDNVFQFSPAVSGKYAFFTTYYNDAVSNGMNDTLIHIYNESDLVATITNGYNDDADLTTQFSRSEVNLSVGQIYYIKISGYAGKKVYARLYAQLIQGIAFQELENKNPVHISLGQNEDAYYRFTPSQSGNYRFYTSGLRGSSAVSDTVLFLYMDNSLTQLVSYNDDVEGRQPYGALYSKIEYTLNQGQTYYVVAASFDGSPLKTRLAVEDSFYSTRQTAIAADWSSLFGSNRNTETYKYDISSLYDVDYYRIIITDPTDFTVGINHNTVSMETGAGDTIGFFNAKQGDRLYVSRPGVYYLQVRYFENSTDLSSIIPPSLFNNYSYEIEPTIFNLNYESQQSLVQARAISESSQKVLDATPHNFNIVSLTFLPKRSYTNVRLMVRTTSGHYIYSVPLVNGITGGMNYTVAWNGSVNIDKERMLYHEGYDRYYARNGIYVLEIHDGYGHNVIYSYDNIQVFNDPLYPGNLTPLPPIFIDKEELVYVNNANVYDCTECTNYFSNYIFSQFGYDADFRTEYFLWKERTYGEEGISLFDYLKWDDSLSPEDNILKYADIVSFIPVIGTVGDLTSGEIHLMRGDYAAASLSAINLIPAVTEFKVGRRILTNVISIRPLRAYTAAIKACFCLAEGTKVQTINGLENIESIQVGDLVLSKNTETGEVDYKSVEEVYEFETGQVNHIYIGNEKIVVTDNHPFWVIGRGWVEASELQPGDVLETSEGRHIPVTNIEVYKQDAKVYNFTVADFHTYYVSELGILTHNLECINFKRYEIELHKMDGSGKYIYTEPKYTSFAKELGRAISKPEYRDGVDNWAAHHIVPKGAYKNHKNINDLLEIQDILNDAKIDINSAANGVWLPMKAGKGSVKIEDVVVTTHNGKHAPHYFEYVREKLEIVDRKDTAAVLNKLQEIREELLTGKIRLGYQE